MKKLFLLPILALIVVMVFQWNIQQDSHSKKASSAVYEDLVIKQFGESLYKTYDSIEELEQDAELIIIGKFTKDIKSLKQTNIKSIEYDPLGEFWVDTPIKVQKVLKGEYKENEIVVAQPILLNYDKYDVLTLDGYSPVIQNATYVFFLAQSEYGSSDNQDFAWNVLSFNYGKYNIDGKDTIEDKLSDENQSKLKKMIKKKYKQ